MKRNHQEIAPDEIFLDSSNLPDYDNNQFEGRIEKPIGRKVLLTLTVFFIVLMVGYVGRIWFLQVKNGQVFADKSQNNALQNTLVFASRGVVNDRNGVPLIWNEFSGTNTDYAYRKYTDLSGMSLLLGYIKYPKKDKSGFYYNTEYDGKDGVEKYFNEDLSGENGLKITETDAVGKVQSESVVKPPKNGNNLILSIDSRIQQSLYNIIATNSMGSGFQGGAGVIMDVHTGEMVAMVSFPEYDSQTMTDGSNVSVINGYFKNKRIITIFHVFQ